MRSRRHGLREQSLYGVGDWTIAARKFSETCGLAVDASNAISDEAENPTEENIPTSLSVSGVTIETESSCAYTVASGFQRGDGSESSPYLICTYAQLNKIRDNLTAYYELG